MRQKFTFFICSFLLMCAPLLSDAQSTSIQEHVFYVQSSNLSVDNYEGLHHKLKTDGRFIIATACIPAHVMTIQVTSSSMMNLSTEENYAAFKSITDQLQINAELLLNYNKDSFENQCRSARTGN